MKIGDKIPEILGQDAQGNVIKASDFAGKKLVIYFYPKDNTPGCTAEACSLSEGYGKLMKAGLALVGVSKDSAASHQKFAAKHNLPFPLIAGKRRRWLDAPTWALCAPHSSPMSRAPSSTSSTR